MPQKQESPWNFWSRLKIIGAHCVRLFVRPTFYVTLPLSSSIAVAAMPPSKQPTNHPVSQLAATMCSLQHCRPNEHTSLDLLRVVSKSDLPKASVCECTIIDFLAAAHTTTTSLYSSVCYGDSVTAMHTVSAMVVMIVQCYVCLCVTSSPHAASAAA